MEIQTGFPPALSPSEPDDSEMSLLPDNAFVVQSGAIFNGSVIHMQSIPIYSRRKMEVNQ